MIDPDNIDFLKIGEKWPPEQHKDRLARYSENKKLFLGQHDAVYHSHFMERMNVEKGSKMIQVLVNFPGAVSKLFADLLFGEYPTFTAKGNEEAQDWIDSFRQNNDSKIQDYKAALAQSYRGDAVYKLRTEDQKAISDVIPATLWFPVTADNDINNIQAHVIAYKDGKMLNVEIHQPGRIDYRRFMVKDDRIKKKLPVEKKAEETGVDMPLVFRVPNLQIDDRVFGIDDYSEADTLFSELDTRLSQISKILDKHSDPNMYGPPKNTELDPATGQERVNVGGEYFEVRQGEEPPGYLTWEGKLNANFEYLDRILDMLYITTDTNQAAFSLMESGNIPSGSAMKRLLMRTVARVSRKKLPFDNTLKDLIITANELERTVNSETPEVESVSSEWRDGLPDDPAEQAEIEKKRTGGKPTSSQRAAIKRMKEDYTEEEIDEEMQRIKEDEQRAAPPGITPTMFGETGEGE